MHQRLIPSYDGKVAVLRTLQHCPCVRVLSERRDSAISIERFILTALVLLSAIKVEYSVSLSVLLSSFVQTVSTDGHSASRGDRTT